MVLFNEAVEFSKLKPQYLWVHTLYPLYFVSQESAWFERRDTHLEKRSIHLEPALRYQLM
jgi:hypothetical protein